MDHRSAVRDASGHRPEIPPGLGGADLQRRRSTAEPDQPVLHAAAVGGAWIEGAGSDRLFIRAVAGAHAASAVPVVGVGDDAGLYGAGDALNERIAPAVWQVQSGLISR